MSNDNIDPQTPPASQEPQTPPAPSADEALAAARKEAADARAEAARIKRENEEMKLNGMKSKDDWKGVADAEKKRADEAVAENDRIKKALIDDKKYAALTAEAVKQGINPVSIPDLELLDFAEVVAESSNGRVVVSGVEAAITALKAKRPNWFSGVVPNVNSSTPQGTVNSPNGNVTLADVKAAETKYYQTKSDSDKKTYEEIIKRFKAQG